MSTIAYQNCHRYCGMLAACKSQSHVPTVSCVQDMLGSATIPSKMGFSSLWFSFFVLSNLSLSKGRRCDTSTCDPPRSKVASVGRNHTDETVFLGFNGCGCLGREFWSACTQAVSAQKPLAATHCTANTGTIVFFHKKYLRITSEIPMGIGGMTIPCCELRCWQCQSQYRQPTEP